MNEGKKRQKEERKSWSVKKKSKKTKEKFITGRFLTESIRSEEQWHKNGK